MKFSCLQENLQKGVSLVRNVVGKNKSLPILSNILLKAEKGSITIESTNLELGIHCTIRGLIEEEGVVAIDAKVFFDYISLLPKEKIIFSCENDFTLHITCGTYTTTLRGVNPDDFPILPFFQSDTTILCDNTQTLYALQGILFSSAPFSETRPELSGVYLHWKDTNTLSFITTDTYRLSYYSINIKQKKGSPHNVIVPLQTLQEIQKILTTQQGEDIEITQSDSQIQFTCGAVRLVSKVIQGTYPDYENIIPKNFSTTLILEKNEFTKAIRATSLFSKSGLFDVCIAITITQEGKGRVDISSANTTIGENSVVLEGEGKGADNTISLNYKYLLDWLSICPEDKIVLRVVDSTTACLFEPIKRENQYYLVMPILE
ncbi:DNA polymerase III subunit beta [Candidatus Uhrbacteria bacterium]|nr:DNA polymerase III subunit beta [Candidatus Uhrbacteria bacterium]